MKRVLVIPDIHYRRKPGGEDRRTLEAVKKYASDHTWSEVVWLGDVVDHNSVSSHNKNNLRAVDGETLWLDYEHANRDLDEWAQATPRAQKVIIEGNHDYRPERLVDAQPQLKGLVETPIGLKLKQRGWKWVPYWSKGQKHHVGKALLIHGRYTGEYHARTHVARYGKSVFYGHVHSVDSHSIVQEGDNSTLVGQSLGCLCDYSQSYLQGVPTKWQQAFAVFYVRDDGFYNYYVVRVFGHKFTSPEGKLYKP